MKTFTFPHTYKPAHPPHPLHGGREGLLGRCHKGIGSHHLHKTEDPRSDCGTIKKKLLLLAKAFKTILF